VRIEGNIGEGEYELFDGDDITVGVTHQIRIAGEDSWVKYEVRTRMRPGETTQQARTRAIGHVDASAMEAVHRVVDTVRKA